MGLFRKKKEEEATPEPPRPVPQNQDNWHEWASFARNSLAEGDLPKAIGYWSDSIAHFDSQPVQYEKFHEEIMEQIIEHMNGEIKKGKVIQAHLLAELDRQVSEKIPEMCGTLFSEDLFYHVKENISSADGPASTARLYVCAAYAVLGYLRFAADMRVSSEKCQEAAKLGRYASEQCLSYVKGKYEGALKPKPAAEFVEAFAVFYDEVQKALDEAISTKSSEELETLVSYRTEHVVDRLDSIGAAMQYSINGTDAGSRKKAKLDAQCSAKITAYIEASMKLES